MSYGFKECAERLVDRCGPLQAERLNEDAWYAVIKLDLSSIFRHFDRPVIVLFAASSRLREVNLEEEFLMHYDSWPIAVILDAYSRATAVLLKKGLFGQSALFVVDELFTDDEIGEAWRQVLLRHASMELLSPYGIDTAVCGRMFFGRGTELSKLRKGHGCAMVFGPRRIGKTSLALRLNRELGMRNTTNSPLKLGGLKINPSSYIDVSGLGESASTDLWGAILREHNLNPREFQQYTRRQRFAGSKANYDLSEASALDAIISSLEGELTIILDEVDGWIERDAKDKWVTLDRLRAMTDRGRAKVVLVGYQSLKWASEYDRFPFALRGEAIQLGPLGRSEFDDLVMLPLADLRIALKPEKRVLNKIWSCTSGVPHLVQDICGRLVNGALNRSRTTLTINDLRDVLETSDVFGLFTKGVINCDFPIAEAICYASILVPVRRQSGSVADFSSAVSLGEIVNILSEFGYGYDAGELESAMNYLALRWILRPVEIEHTVWRWVNEYQHARASKVLSAAGVENCFLNLLNRHEAGDWRKRYRRLTEHK